jgi:hypothetical protein
MFGIKTKKDKRIEELEKLLNYAMAQRPSIATIERDVVTLRATQILEPGMPVDFAKKHIAREMAEHLENHIEYDVRDSEYHSPLVEGTLYVCIRKGGAI